MPEVVFGVPLGTPNNFLFWMDSGHLLVRTYDSTNIFGTICQPYIYASVYTREVKHYNMMICEDVGLFFFLLHGS